MSVRSPLKRRIALLVLALAAAAALALAPLASSAALAGMSGSCCDAPEADDFGEEAPDRSGNCECGGNCGCGDCDCEKNGYPCCPGCKCDAGSGGGNNPPPPNPVTRRALVLSAPYDISWVDGDEIEHIAAIGASSVTCAQNMFTEHLGSSAVSTHVNSPRTSSAVESAIQSAFGSADSNDVSYLYIHCHSSADVRSNFELCMCLNANNWENFTNPSSTQSIRTSELRGYLNAISGKKVVFLDTCYAGAIWDDSNGQAVLYKGGVEGNQASNFEILCSSTYDQESWNGDTGMGYATYGWAYGSGWDASAPGALLSLPADSNSNGSITTYELNAFARNTVFLLNFPYSLIPGLLPGSHSQETCFFDNSVGLYAIFV